MKDHEKPEAVQARAEQEDPIVMYLIVHESLGMGVGKTAAQCAHASQMLTLDYFELKDRSRLILKDISTLKEKPHAAHELLIADLKKEYTEVGRKISIFGEWMASSFRKVVLRADDKDWAKLKTEFKDSMVMVVDAGLTEIAAGSETVIGLWPMRKSQVPKTVKRLQVLK